MSTRTKNKIVLVITLLLSLLYFFNDFSLIDIEKTAIIVALGVDKVEEGVEITAQIGVPHATEKALDNADTLISAKGKTVMDAIEVLSARSGWFPKLSFCNFIVFGKALAYDDVTQICNHILSSEHFQNSALLAVCDDTAKNFLSTKTPLDSISSFAIQKILIENGITSSRILDTDVKNFSESVRGKSGCGYMPYITTIKNEAKGEEDSSAATTSFKNYQKTHKNRPIDRLFDNLQLEDNSEKSGNGGSKSSDSSTAIFDAGKTAVFKNGKIVDILTEKETIAYNLLYVPADSILVSTESNGKTATLEIFQNKRTVSVDYLKRPTLHLKLTLTVRIADGNTDYTEDNSLGWRATVPKEFLDALSSDVASTLKELSVRMLNNDIDLFNIRTLTYKYHNFKYDDYKKLPLSCYDVNIAVKASSKDSTSKPR